MFLPLVYIIELLFKYHPFLNSNLETSCERLLNWIRIPKFLGQVSSGDFQVYMSEENQSRKFRLIGLPSKLLWTKVIRENM